MAGSVNKIILIGNLGGDPDIRQTKDGRDIASFSVATSESWRDKTTGERKERTQWHRVVVFNEGLARLARDYLKKGSKVYIEGQYLSRKWTDKSGIERETYELVLKGFNSVITMMDSRKGDRPPDAGADDYGMDPDTAGGPPPIDDEVPY